MEKYAGIQWLIRIVNLLLSLLVLFIIMKLSPIWLPIIKVVAKISVPFLIAGTIVYLLHPIIEKFHRSGIRRSYAVLGIFVVFFGLLSLLIIKGTPFLMTQLKELIEHLPEYIVVVEGWLESLNEKIAIFPIGLQEQIFTWLDGIQARLETLFETLAEWFMSALSWLIYFIVIPFLVFYLLKDYEALEKTAWYLTPKKWRKQGMALLKGIDESFGNYIRGQILVSLFVGVIAMIGLYFLGVPYSILLGLVIGVLDIIPYFGAFLGAIPAVVVAAIHSWKLALIVIGFIFVLQQIEGHVLSPLIVGKSLAIHPIFIIIAVLLGIEIGGVIGLILAVPMLAILKVILLHTRMNLH